jgi:YD repeat-containing protein
MSNRKSVSSADFFLSAFAKKSLMRALPAVLICALLAPAFFVGGSHARPIMIADQSSQTLANASAPEPFIFTTEQSFSGKVSSALARFAGGTWRRFNDLFAVAEIPAGLGAAKAPSLIDNLSEEISALSQTSAAYFGFAANSPATIAAAASMPLPVAPSGTASFDYDGDGKADLSRWQSSNGEWRIKSSLSGTVSNQTLGWSSDKIVPADYDADGKTDIASFGASAGAWTIKQSSTGTNISRTLGQSGDIPVSANYGGDSRADSAVFRPSNGTWYYIVTGDATNTVVSQAWGASGDVAVPGNYDGDSYADFAVFRPSTGYWFVLQSSNGGMTSVQWGFSSDTLVPADYDGDGKTDRAVYRPSTGSWYAYKSSTNNGEYIAQTWGNWGDQPVPADYNNDGRADLAVWRAKTGVWHIAQTATGGGYTYSYQQLGASGDLATPAAYLKKIGASVAMPWVHKERLSPKNATGGIDLYSQNFSWSTGLIGLSGRAGLDAGFGISYNSLIWTKVPTDTETAMIFDADSSNVSPGFRFGFPVIEQSYPDYRTGRFTYIMVTPSGARVDFRQIAASDTYETGDSSYTQLKVDNNSGPNTPVENLKIKVTTSDGTEMKYDWLAGMFRCSEIKDTNGNRISISHDATGLLKTVTDTLNRVITVNYDAELYPISITQTWKGANGTGADTTHTWATFSYISDTANPINTSFGTGLTIYGPTNGTVVRVLNKITRADDSYTKFDYNSYGQVKKITNYAKNNDELNSVSTNLGSVSGTQTDCPRFTETSTTAANFNQNQAVVVSSSKTTTTVTGITDPVMLIAVTAPDGITANGVVIEKSYMLQSGWREALPFQTETCTTTSCTGTDKKRWTSTVWAQDDNSLVYRLNPRVAESVVNDAANSKKTEIVYETISGQPTVAKYGRVKETKIYNNLTNQLLKRSVIEYKEDDVAYLSRRILNLPSEIENYGRNELGVETLGAKTKYEYDGDNFSDGTLEQNISPVQRDNDNYGTSLVNGRGNLTKTIRCDAALSSPTTCAGGIESTAKYNTAGAVVSQTTPGSAVGTTRTIKISYADKFNDGINTRNTYAYPTKITDSGGNFSEVKYRFDTGANVWASSPAPAGNSRGKETTRVFDQVGRLEKEFVWKTVQQSFVEYAFTRYQYFDNNVQSKVYSTVTDTDGDDMGETIDEVLVSETFTDGAGRVRKSRAPMSWNTNGTIATYSAQYIEYDVLGRVKKQSTPAETNDVVSSNGNWKIPADNPDYRGEDASLNSLFLWTSQTYDWNGRVVQTVSTDNKTTDANFDGCGCAGGQTVTISGEEVETGKRRKQKIYSDSLGRQWKTEVINWDTNQPLTTTVNKFNERNQVTKVTQYAGAESGSNTNQTVTTTYDGHGRMQTRHYPIEDDGKVTTWAYNADDSISTITDPRGVVTTFLYNSRGLVENIQYAQPPNNPASTDLKHVPATPAVTYTYDNAGNRTQMSETLGSETNSTTYAYDELSRMTSETKHFADFPSNNYTISYNYHLSGGLKSYTDPFSSTVNYTNDKLGRLTAVAGTAFGDNTTGQYADSIQYRAWGAVKQLNYKSDDNLLIKMEYDARLRVSEHSAYSSVNGFIQKAMFEYFADSRPKAMDNQIDNKFDRSFGYDSVGRLVSNTFGGASVGVPYSQTIAYDAFSNMTQRNTTHWGAGNNFNAEYLNGRKKPAGTTIPVYDAAGNMINPGSRADTGETNTTSYDAANRPREVKTVYQRRVRNNLGSYVYASFEKIMTQYYDGDGRPVKDIETDRRVTTPPQGGTLTTKYQIWSSVFNSPLTSLNNFGAKEKTKVFAGGAVVAEQVNASSRVEWTTADPVTGSSQKVYKNGTFFNDQRKELEAFGQEVLPTEPIQEIPEQQITTSLNTADQPEWMCQLADGMNKSFWDRPSHCQRAILESGKFSIAGLLAEGRSEKSIRSIELTGINRGGRNQPTVPHLIPTFKPTGGALASGFGAVSASSIPTLSGLSALLGSIGNQTVLATVQSLPAKDDWWDHFDASNSGFQNGKVEFQDKTEVEKQRKKTLDILRNDEECRKYLAAIEGLKIDELIKAVELQRIYDGKNSTINRLDAGFIDPGTNLSTQAGQITAGAAINNIFTAQRPPNAQTGIFTGPIVNGRTSVGLTLASRSDVYYRKLDLVVSARIIHEALHSLFGVGDDALATKLRVTVTKDDTSAITQKLKDNGCGK